MAIASPYVYKVKKPLDLGFLDFSTLEKRRHFCLEEVRLNRRLTHDVYLDVVPIARRDGCLHFGPEGEIVEYAVKMRELARAGFLHERLARGAATVRRSRARGGQACRVLSGAAIIGNDRGMGPRGEAAIEHGRKLCADRALRRRAPWSPRVRGHPLFHGSVLRAAREIFLNAGARKDGFSIAMAICAASTSISRARRSASLTASNSTNGFASSMWPTISLSSRWIWTCLVDRIWESVSAAHGRVAQ